MPGARVVVERGRRATVSGRRAGEGSGGSGPGGSRRSRPARHRLARGRSTRESARREQCRNNLKQIGLAMQATMTPSAAFPPAAIVDKQGKPMLSWRVAILPYLGRAVYPGFDLDEPWDSPHNLALVNDRPDVFACSSDLDLKPGMTGYQVVVGGTRRSRRTSGR